MTVAINRPNIYVIDAWTSKSYSMLEEAIKENREKFASKTTDLFYLGTSPDNMIADRVWDLFDNGVNLLQTEKEVTDPWSKDTGA